MTVPYAFANLSGNIALAKLDSNFNTPITIGNTSVLLGNTVTTLNNLTLANVTISSGTASNISLTSPLAVSSGGTGSANLTVNNVLIGNGTSAVTSVAPGTTGNVLTSIGGAWVSNAVVNNAAAGSNTQVQYNNSGALGASANLVFDGTNLGIGTSSPARKLVVYEAATGSTIQITDSVSGTGAAAGSIIQQSFADQSLLIRNYAPAGYIRFDTAGASEKMRLNSSGNLGLGVTPSAWGTFSSVFQGVGYSLAGFSSGTNVQSALYCNAFFNGTNYIYRGSAAASQYLQISGEHQWFNAPVGTAGNAITFTQAMTLDASGNLGIGTSSPNASAILDAQSTTKGVRMPNMTTTQKNAIASPAAGLMVFDTTLAKLCVYSGSAWQTITSV